MCVSFGDDSKVGKQSELASGILASPAESLRK